VPLRRPLAGIEALGGVFFTWPVNETLMRGRWKLGRALAKWERGNAPGTFSRGSTGLKALFKSIGTTPQTAMQAQRIGTLPREKREKFRVINNLGVCG
jgi:hypothetical protein